MSKEASGLLALSFAESGVSQGQKLELSTGKALLQATL